MQKQINTLDGGLIDPKIGMHVECEILENANLENVNYVKERIQGSLFLIKEIFEDGIVLLNTDTGSHTIPVLPVYCTWIPDDDIDIEFITKVLNPNPSWESISNQQPMEATMQEQQPKENQHPNAVIDHNAIDYSDMVKALAKPGEDIIATLTPETAHQIHMAIGISGESGELLDAVKKAAIYNKPIDRENVIEELGDLEFYMEGIRQGLNITRDETLVANKVKLSKRYASLKYSDTAAQARADKTQVA